MAGHRGAKIALAGGAALVSALAFSAPAQAADVSNIVSYASHTRAQAVSYGANGAVRICDTYADGYGVAVRYYRTTGNLQWLRNNNGAGSSHCVETSDIPSNPIAVFSACVRIEGVDYCNTTWADTDRW
ncbi:hypothetical protein ABZ901_16650 [Actinacidiphila alni]|uniref:hypothetical protein n=1 Tax=Actinacidiphila alni TaxID=380248 RepID=UPI0033C9E6C1